MAAPRPIWKGQLRLSLVSIPVEMYSATRTGARVSFRQIHGPTGRPISYQKTVPGVGPVDRDEILSGFEVEKDSFILIEPEEIEAVKLESKKTFELVQFVGACEIAPLYFNKPYYLVPADDLAEDAYRVVRDALRATETVGLGQVTMRGREYVCAVKPCGSGLLAETLHYADEIREAEPLFAGLDETKPDPELLAVATQLIERKRRPFDAAAFEDTYSKALRELIEAKRRSRRTPRVSTGGAEAPRGENVVDLMAALKQSLERAGGKPPAQSAGRGAGRSKPARAKTRAEAGTGAEKADGGKAARGGTRRKKSA